MKEDKKVFKNNKKENKEKKVHEETHLTYNIAEELDKLFPQYKPSKKKEENK